MSNWTKSRHRRSASGTAAMVRTAQCPKNLVNRSFSARLPHRAGSAEVCVRRRPGQLGARRSCPSTRRVAVEAVAHLMRCVSPPRRTSAITRYPTEQGGGTCMSKRNDLMTTEETALYVRLSPRTLERYRVTGQGPTYLKNGRRAFYRQADLDQWLENNRRRSTSDPGPEPKHKSKRTVQRSKNRTRRPPSDPDSEPPSS